MLIEAQYFELFLTKPLCNLSLFIHPCNEETTPVEVFFDDFKVTHTKSAVSACGRCFHRTIALNR